MRIPSKAELQNMSTRNLEFLSENDDLPSDIHDEIMTIIERRQMGDYFTAALFGADGSDDTGYSERLYTAEISA